LKKNEIIQDQVSHSSSGAFNRAAFSGRLKSATAAAAASENEKYINTFVISRHLLFVSYQLTPSGDN
jgi:hypothetical protein